MILLHLVVTVVLYGKDCLEGVENLENSEFHFAKFVTTSIKHKFTLAYLLLRPLDQRLDRHTSLSSSHYP